MEKTNSESETLSLSKEQKTASAVMRIAFLSAILALCVCAKFGVDDAFVKGYDDAKKA